MFKMEKISKNKPKMRLVKNTDFKDFYFKFLSHI